MRDRSVFGFAGLWEEWTDKASGEIVRSCTIVVTTANALLAPIHDRMPVILDPADWATWLGESSPSPRRGGELAADEHATRHVQPSVCETLGRAARGPAVRREGEGTAVLHALLKPYPAERMACFKIGPKIGNVKYDEAGLVAPVN